jgi:hypothetical protein
MSDEHEEELNVNQLDLGVGLSGVSESDLVEQSPVDTEAQLYDALAALDKANEEIRQLHLALVMLKKYALQNGLDLTSIGFSQGEKPLKKKPTELTPDEIIARNAQVSNHTQRRAFSKEVIPQPSADELLKLYNDRHKAIKEAAPATQSLVNIFLKEKETPVVDTMPKSETE